MFRLQVLAMVTATAVKFGDLHVSLSGAVKHGMLILAGSYFRCVTYSSIQLLQAR